MIFAQFHDYIPGSSIWEVYHEAIPELESLATGALEAPGSVLRSQWPGYPREEAQWEVPASRWMALVDDAQSEGMAVITEAKYGFTVRDGAVGISLVRRGSA